MGFIYSSLRPGQLRLLRPVWIVDGRSISLEISNFLRQSAPPYAAVSYTWGEGDDMETLQLNGQDFPIRRNLWSCLNYLGQNARHSEARYLWVDAICINQGNIEERNAQVRVMDEIYSNACFVSIWLGLDPRLDLYKHRIHDPILTFDTDSFDWFDYAKELANHEYWSRYWVIQECLLARNIQVHCGKYISTWDNFLELVSHEANMNPYSSSKDEHTTALDSRKYGAIPLLLARNDLVHISPQRPLEELIIHHSHSRCKDPRDRVFALLGLLESAERESLQQVFPNYSLSHDSVVAITLAHLSQMHCAPLTMKSQKLFQGLGVDSKEKQKKLISAAERCGYMIEYGGVSSDESRKQRAMFLDLEEEEEVDENDFETFEYRPSSTSGCNIL